MKPCSVTPIIALSLLLSVQPVYADCGPSQIGPPCAFGGMAAQGSAEPSISLGAGNPIHLATGNKYQHDIDLPANATAPGLELVRHYNALDPRASVLGHGWTLSYDARLYRAGSAWQIVQADGRRLMFPDTGITQDGSHIGPHGRLDHIHDHHNWFWPTGTTARFDQNGRLVALRHPNGESVYIERDDTNGPLHGTIQRVVNDRGQALEFSYTVDNDVARLRAVTTPLGKFKYDHDTEPVDTAKSSQVAGPVNRQTDVSEYDQHPGHTARGHRLIRVTRPDGMTRSYAYDADHQAGNPYALTGIAISTSAGNKPVQTLQLGSWSYDAQGRAVSYRSGVADEAANHLRVNYQQSPSPKGPGHTVVTDGQGRETHVHIALRGRQYRVTAVTGEGCQGCPAPGTRADYDEDGRLVSVNGMGITRTPDGRINVLRPARAGWPGLSLHYDAGRRTHWHSDITGTEHMQYNAHGLPAKRRFANDDTVRFDLDAIIAHQASQIVDTQWKWLLLELSRPAAATEVTPIDILGFSRGAALARHFGNMISQHTHQGLFQFNDPIYGAVSACVDLRFMGLFDTVAQFGVAGSRNHNYDLGIAAGWEWVAHAVAMHERRWLYPLTSAGSALSHNVVEAPFIGAHADIGGGIVSVGQNTPADSGDLSNVALQWMLWQARAASVPMAPAGPDDTAITNPILNDYRPPLLRTIQDGDRRVDAPDGSRWLNYQNDHIRLGRGTRRQTESLIQREPDWERQSGSKVGVVDMDGYARWLQEELGWQAVPV